MASTTRTIAELFKCFGRDAASVVGKFRDVAHFQACDSHDLKRLGIKTQLRKYLLSSKHWYSQGIIQHCPIAKRQQKHLALKERVKTLRLQKLGLA